MTTKERLLNCIYHKPTDRVPVDTYGYCWNDDSWECKEPSHASVVQHVRQYADCIFYTNMPVVRAPNPFVQDTEWRKENSLYIKSVYNAPGGDLSMLCRYDDALVTEWIVEHVAKSIEDAERYLSIPYQKPTVDTHDFEQKRKKLGDNGLMMIGLPDPIGLCGSILSMDEMLILAMTETERFKGLCDTYHERGMAVLQDVLQHDMQDVIFNISGPEYASPPYLPRALFEELVTGYLVDMCHVIRKAGAIPRIHCHGNVRTLLAEFAKTEALIIEPLEPPPQGDITLAEAKQQYGKRFCLLGNIEFLDLEAQTTDKIDELVYHAMQEAKQDGGYMLMATTFPITRHLPEKTAENFNQMLLSAHRYGQY